MCQKYAKVITRHQFNAHTAWEYTGFGYTIALNNVKPGIQQVFPKTSKTKGRNPKCNFKAKAAGPALHFGGQEEQIGGADAEGASVPPLLPRCHLLYCNSLFSQEGPVKYFHGSFQHILAGLDLPIFISLSEVRAVPQVSWKKISVPLKLQ